MLLPLLSLFSNGLLISLVSLTSLGIDFLPMRFVISTSLRTSSLSLCLSLPFTILLSLRPESFFISFSILFFLHQDFFSVSFAIPLIACPYFLWVSGSVDLPVPFFFERGLCQGISSSFPILLPFFFSVFQFFLNGRWWRWGSFELEPPMITTKV